VVVVEGGSGRPLTEDIWSGQLAQIRPENYDTSAARQDMEMLVGGGDAARGSVLKAKTATEAEIVSQGLRGRSAERTDVIEDLLTDVGKYVLEMCLRKLSPQDVQEIAGPQAQWPQWTAEQVFKQVSLGVRGGSTGKPDRLQEQDRWTKLLPVIKEAMGQVSELRQAGQEDMAQAVIELVRETLRRFDERVDINQFLPKPKEGEQGAQGPQVTQQQFDHAKQLVEELQAKLAEAEKALQDKAADRDAEIQKAQITAQSSVESAEEVARIKAAADIEIARINAAAKALQPTPAEPGGVMGVLDGLEAQDQRSDATMPEAGEPAQPGGVHPAVAAMLGAAPVEAMEPGEPQPGQMLP